MRKNAETSHANKDCKLANVVFIPTSPFSKQEFVEHFPNVICTKKGLLPYYFLFENQPL